MSLETFLLLSLLVELCYCFNLNYIASFVESMLFFHIYWEVFFNFLLLLFFYIAPFCAPFFFSSFTGKFMIIYLLVLRMFHICLSVNFAVLMLHDQVAPAVASIPTTIARKFPTSVLLQEQRDEYRPFPQALKDERTFQV